MNHGLDRSVLVETERGAGALERVPEDEEHCISVITVSELLHGVHRASDGARRARRTAFVEHVLAEIEALPVSVEVARSHAELWAQLQASGEVMGAHETCGLPPLRSLAECHSRRSMRASSSACRGSACSRCDCTTALY